MNRTLICLFLHLQCICLSAQTKNDTTVIHVVENNIPDKIALPYSAIEVLDARFDQTKIGCVFGKNSFIGYSLEKTNAVFPDTFKDYLPIVLNNIIQIDTSSQEKLLVLVKRFRIADFFQSTVGGSNWSHLALNVSASFYATKGNVLVKLFSIDDVFSTIAFTGKEPKKKFHDALKETSYETRSKAIITMLAKALRGKNWIVSDKAFNTQREELIKAVAKRFDLPVYNNQQPQQGLYLGFKEFKEDRPSVTAIKIIYKKDKIEKVLNEKGEPIEINKIWGLSDGQKRYMVFRGKLNELISCDKSFRILSYRTKAETRGATNYGELAGRGYVIAGAITKLSDNSRIDEYFDLNMENGELFLEELVGTSTMRRDFFK